MLRAALAVACTVFLVLAAFERTASGGFSAEPKVPQPRAAYARPDIVLVTVDALRKDHVSDYG